jgi:hypothetical protein
MTYLLLARQVEKGISPTNKERFGQSIKFYMPGKKLPHLDVDWYNKNQVIIAAQKWIDRQPGLDQPAKRPQFFARGKIPVVMFVIEQDWKHPDGRYSDWVSAWTSCGWGTQFGRVLVVARNWFADQYS